MLAPLLGAFGGWLTASALAFRLGYGWYGVLCAFLAGAWFCLLITRPR